MEACEILADCLATAATVADDISANNVSDITRLLWLEKQLANIVALLQAWLADIEAGLTVADIGFFCEQDFENTVNDFQMEIVKLKGMIRSLKMVVR